MKSEFIPTIRLEIEGMKSSIMRAIGLHNNELSDMVNRKIEEAIKSHDFEKDVEEATHECIKESIYELFQYNGAGRCLIRKTIRTEFEKIFNRDNNSNEET